MNQSRGRQRRHAASLACLAAGFLGALAACGEGGQRTLLGGGGGFFGAVSADEPLAALAGRDVLSSGGNAIDAAVAMYFALSVTLPSAASLGAGGVCIANQQKSRKTEAFVFPAVAAPGSPPGTTFAIPTAVRGITLMHVRYGNQRWEQLIAHAERWARPPGAPVSRALARDLREGAAIIGADPEARRIYDKGGGVAFTEGDVFPQGDVSGILGGIKARGGADFFAGGMARQISDGWRNAGGSLPPETLRATVPTVMPPLAQSWGNHTAYFAPAPFAGSATQAAWQAGPRAAPPGGAGFEGGSAGFVAVDREGNGAACNVGMGQLFGARKVAPGTGIMIGAATGRDQQVLGPMMIANRNTGDVLLVGAASGSAVAPAALGAAAAQVMQGNMPIGQAIQGSAAVLDMIACPQGVRESPGACRFATDPKGFGLALAGERPSTTSR